ncbi:SusC/RagA family TonB-linked outer membrane protein [Cesiribacter sp. SM1]|uniref:SusC/RagA family TonB-linked outer membrane protein n=1 Tax=Cesiribacter sp. SM1 TaxID=2861196 RepID=UPI001CD25338|nr:SusC/RagA family TonB-linked outer membrane protein [Cesiribacter sp. SM1]
MKIHLLIFYFLLFLLRWSLPAHAQEEAERDARILRGKVLDEGGQPLPGVNLLLKASRGGTVTDSDGLFSLRLPPGVRPGADTLQVSYIGYTTEEFPLPATDFLEVRLLPDIENLMAVEIVSTGYQQLPKERSTGSFVQVDEELFNRSVSPDILSRLDGIASGLLLQPQAGGRELSIRGRSTLFANSEPLIVVDNFPYDGDLASINPNDVENITLLKDAAAASIWGARAGNGVIVITTKQGRHGQAPQLSFNSNVTVGEQPDAFYIPRMSTGDYMATEQALFEGGYYGAYERAADKRAISPFVELLILHREGRITDAELEAERARLQEGDVRKDFERYLYQQPLHQQVAASLRGGDHRQRYYFSAGYDKALERLIGDENSRITLNAKNSWAFFRQKLRFSTDLYYIEGRTVNNGLDPQGLRQSNFDALPPYSRLADEGGNPLPLIRDYRLGFVQGAEAAGLPDWRYRPLEERELVDRSNRLRDFRANLELGYQLLPELQASLRYQYWNSNGLGRDHYGADSYYARDLVNRFTQLEDDGSLSRAIPMGGILDERRRLSQTHNLRAQLLFAKLWGDRHELNALAGWEMKGMETGASSFRYYGYQEEGLLVAPYDGVTRYPQYQQPSRRQIVPGGQQLSLLHDRFISYYANAAYTYHRRYLLTLSGRRDLSNLFGVEANQRGVPLWSAGLGWNLHGESFYRWKALPYLKLRGSWGYNGNIDKSVTAFTTARLQGRSWDTGLPYASITNPPNPALRWERVRILNGGLDFATRNHRLSGSLEYYLKRGEDLIGDALLSPVTGRSQFRGNVSSTEGRGVDLTLSSLNLQGNFRWQTDWLWSHARTLVTGYEAEAGLYQLLSFGLYPREGYPPLAIYSIPWAGLNPLNGNPQGWLNGERSEDWSAIINNMTGDSLLYHGPAQPQHFGGLRNTFSWKGISLSCNLTYSLGYYFRRESIRYGNNRGLGGHGDWSYRWQQPGDEVFTQVPSIPERGNSYRDDFYLYSEALVERGDHLRLQDVNLSYTLSREQWERLPFRQLQLYAYARNLGILWKATDKVPDPDYRTMPAPRSLALGLRADF